MAQAPAWQGWLFLEYCGFKNNNMLRDFPCKFSQQQFVARMIQLRQQNQVFGVLNIGRDVLNKM